MKLHMFDPKNFEWTIIETNNYNNADTINYLATLGLPVALVLENGGILLDEKSFQNDFIKKHEMGHVMAGHCDQGRERINLSSDPVEYAKYINREIEADANAIRMGASKDLAISTLQYLRALTEDIVSRNPDLPNELISLCNKEVVDRIAAIEAI